MRRQSTTPLSNDASDEQIEEWTKAGLEECQDDLDRIIQTSRIEKPIPLRRTNPLQTTPGYYAIAESRLPQTFRLLASFRPSSTPIDAFIANLLTNVSEPSFVDEATARKEREWLSKYKERIQSESERQLWSGEDGDLEEKRVEEARFANPRFVLRYWVLEEVIKCIEEDEDPECGLGTRMLGMVMQMACNQYKSWGGEDLEGENGLTEEQKEERRLCGVGERAMLGFQCSCSS